MGRPIVFLTDYGLEDEFVGVCHGVMARISPQSRVIDLTHAIRRQDVARGALVLAGAARYMPDDAVYVGVVDPGVGTARRAVAVETSGGAALVGPDNGLLSLAWEELGGIRRAVEVTAEEVLLRPVSATFHGRDVFAPAGAHLAAGRSVESLGPPLDAGSLAVLALPAPDVAPGEVRCRVIGVDRFGNVQTNARAAHLAVAGLDALGRLAAGAGAGGRVAAAARVSAFAEVPEGELAVLVDSGGWVALAVNRGSAGAMLELGPGDEVTFRAA